MANTRRIPFVLNMDDPVDATIWEALEPLLQRHRASQFIRGAIAQALGLTTPLSPPLMKNPPVEPSPRAQLAAPLPQAKRPTTPRLPAPPEASHADEGQARDEALGNFLAMFG